MGLDVTHEAFSGAYSAFNRFRAKLMQAWGGTWPDRDSDLIHYPHEVDDESGFHLFFSGSDCDGKFTPEQAKRIADDLETLIPALEKIDNGGGGHISRDGGYVAVLQKYIAGCRSAHAANEPLEYR